MSFSSPPPSAFPPRVGGGTLRATSIASMGQKVGVVVGAGVLAAIYQIVGEEGRTILADIRRRSALKRARRDAVLIGLLGSTLSPDLQLILMKARNPYDTALKMLAHPLVNYQDRELLRETLQRAVSIHSA